MTIVQQTHARCDGCLRLAPTDNLDPRHPAEWLGVTIEEEEVFFCSSDCLKSYSQEFFEKRAPPPTPRGAPRWTPTERVVLGPA